MNENFYNLKCCQFEMRKFYIMVFINFFVSYQFFCPLILYFRPYFIYYYKYKYAMITCKFILKYFSVDQYS